MLDKNKTILYNFKKFSRFSGLVYLIVPFILACVSWYCVEGKDKKERKEKRKNI